MSLQKCWNKGCYVLRTISQTYGILSRVLSPWERKPVAVAIETGNYTVYVRSGAYDFQVRNSLSHPVLAPGHLCSGMLGVSLIAAQYSLVHVVLTMFLSPISLCPNPTCPLHSRLSSKATFSMGLFWILPYLFLLWMSTAECPASARQLCLPYCWILFP